MSEQGTTRKPTAGRRHQRAVQRWERAQRHPGDRGGGYSPSINGSSPWTDQEERDRYLDREVEVLQRALEDRGELRRRELGRLVGCKYWGPAPRNALRAAVARGAIEHTGFGRYGPARG